MAKKKEAPEPFKVGDYVGIRYSEWRAVIVEERGPLAPGGMLVFRIRIAESGKPHFVEVREDQLIRLPPPKLDPVETANGLQPSKPKKVRVKK